MSNRIRPCIAIAVIALTGFAPIANAAGRDRDSRPSVSRDSGTRSERQADRRQDARQDRATSKRRNDRFDDRRDDRRSDRADDRRHDRYHDRREWREGRYDDLRRAYWRNRIIRRLVTLPPRHVVIHHTSATYYIIDGEYFILKNGGYISVEPISGVVITTLPIGYEMLDVRGVPHYYYGGVYYKTHSHGFMIVHLR